MSSRGLAAGIALVGVAGLGAAGWLLLGPAAEPAVPPEVAVRAVFTQCVKAANMRDPGAIIRLAAPDFVGPQKVTKQYLTVGLAALRNPDLAMVFNPKLTVTATSPTTAQADGTLVFSRTKAMTLETLPRSSVAGIYKVTTKLELRDGAWLFTQADYVTADEW